MMRLDLISNSLRKKILLGYLAIALLLVITGGWAIYNFIRLNRAINEIMIASYRSVGAAQNMIAALERQDNTEAQLLLSNRHDNLDLFLTEQQEFSKWYTVAAGNITFRGEAETLRRINDNYQQYLKLFSRLNELHVSGGPGQARQFYLNMVLTRFTQVRRLCNRLLQINQNQMVRADQRAKNDAKEAVFSTTAVSLLTLLLAIAFGYKISAIIIEPTLKLTESAKKIGAGHLEEIITVKTHDEIGRLAQEFNRMAQRLQEYDRNNIDKLIAERRKADAIVRSIPDPLIVVDADSKIMMINAAAERFFAIREKLVKGLHVLEVINNDRVFGYIKECSATRLPIKSIGMAEAIKLKSGANENYFLVEATPVEDREGRLLGIVLFMGDVTHLKAVDRMKSDFVSAASHEFRTPLTSITMSVGLMLDRTVGAINAKQEQLLEVVKEDCNRLTYLVNDLLDLSRMEAGKVEMAKETVRLLEIVQTAVNPFAVQIEEKGLHMEISPEIANLPSIQADTNKMVRVFNNLIANAIRYTPRGGQITISARSEAERILVSVKDTGSGIDPEYQGKIFEKFIQVNSNEADSPGGAGLGLAMVKEIIQAHGGEIWVESAARQGSNFLFYLPLASAKSEKDDTDERLK